MAETSYLWREIQAWMDVLPYPPTQARLAKRLGLTRSAMTGWKYGTIKPTPDHLRALADEMAPVAGPDIYNTLLRAVMTDLGYDAAPPTAG